MPTPVFGEPPLVKSYGIEIGSLSKAEHFKEQLGWLLGDVITPTSITANSLRLMLDPLMGMEVEWTIRPLKWGKSSSLNKLPSCFHVGLTILGKRAYRLVPWYLEWGAYSTIVEWVAECASDCSTDPNVSLILIFATGLDSIILYHLTPIHRSNIHEQYAGFPPYRLCIGQIFIRCHLLEMLHAYPPVTVVFLSRFERSLGSSRPAALFSSSLRGFWSPMSA